MLYQQGSIFDYLLISTIKDRSIKSVPLNYLKIHKKREGSLIRKTRLGSQCEFLIQKQTKKHQSDTKNKQCIYFNILIALTFITDIIRVVDQQPMHRISSSTRRKRLITAS